MPGHEDIPVAERLTQISLFQSRQDPQAPLWEDGEGLGRRGEKVASGSGKRPKGDPDLVLGLFPGVGEPGTLL